MVMNPMLVSEAEHNERLINSQAYVYVQPKHDGWRGVAHTESRTLLSRKGNPIQLPAITNDLPYGFAPWLDGEIYSHGLPLSKMASAVHKQDTRLALYVFDIPMARPFSERLAVMRLINETANIRVAETYRIRPAQIDEYYQRFMSEGYEGIIIRIDGHPYQHSRTNKVLRLKPQYVNPVLARLGIKH